MRINKIKLFWANVEIEKCDISVNAREVTNIVEKLLGKIRIDNTVPIIADIWDAYKLYFWGEYELMDLKLDVATCISELYQDKDYLMINMKFMNEFTRAIDDMLFIKLMNICKFNDNKYIATLEYLEERCVNIGLLYNSLLDKYYDIYDVCELYGGIVGFEQSPQSKAIEYANVEFGKLALAIELMNNTVIA